MASEYDALLEAANGAPEPNEYDVLLAAAEPSAPVETVAAGTVTPLEFAQAYGQQEIERNFAPTAEEVWQWANTPAVRLPRFAQQNDPLNEVSAGIINTGATLTEGLTSPLNLALLPATAIKRVGRVASLAFGGHMLSQLPEQIRAAYDAPTLQQKIERGGEALGGLVLGGAALKHGIKPKARELAAPAAKANVEYEPLIEAAKQQEEVKVNASTQENIQSETARVEADMPRPAESSRSASLPGDEAIPAGPGGAVEPARPEPLPQGSQADAPPPLVLEQTDQPQISSPEGAASNAGRGSAVGSVTPAAAPLTFQPFAALPDELAAPKLRSGEKQGDLLSTQTEDLTLVGEKGIDHAARQAEAEAAARTAAEAQRIQEAQQMKMELRNPAELEAEYRSQLIEDAEAGMAAQGPEFKEALIKAGGLPSRGNPHRTAEIAELEQVILNPQRTERIAPNQIFRKTAAHPDEIATRMRDYGFDVPDENALYAMADQRFRGGKKIYGMPAREAFAAGEVPGFGPGAASARERLATYEERKFGNRLQADENIAEQIRGNLSNLYYEVIPNAITAEEAVARVNERPIAETMAAVRDESTALPFHIRSAMGQLVIKRLNAVYDRLKGTAPESAERVQEAAIEMAEWSMDFGTRLGQGVQSFAMWARLSPEGKLASVKRTVRKTRERYTAEHGDDVAEITKIAGDTSLTPEAKRVQLLRLKTPTARKVRPLIDKIIEASRQGILPLDKFYELTAKRLGLPGLDATHTREILRLARKVDAAAEGMPRDHATLELNSYIARLKGFDPRDVPLGIYYANMLSGYNTQIVNSLDTLLNVSGEVSTMALTHPRQAARIMEGLLRGFNDGRLDFLQALSKGRMITDSKWLEGQHIMEIARFGEKGGIPVKTDTRTGRIVKAVYEARPAKILNGWKYVGRLMAASDSFMFRGAQEARAALLADHLAREEGLSGSDLSRRVNELLGYNRTADFGKQATAEGFTGREHDLRVAELRRMQRPQNLQAESADFAGLATYNHDPAGALGWASRHIAKMSDEKPILKLFVPFTRIVANVTNRGLNYTPWGFKRALFGYDATHRARGVSMEERNAMLTRASIGMIATGALLALQQSGHLEINGAGPDEPARRRQLEAAGWKPYSLRIGQAYYSYTYTPVGLFLSILGNVSDSYRYKTMGEKDALTRAAYATLRIGSTIFSQSFLAGLSNLFRMLGKPEEALPSTKNFLASTVGTATTPRLALDLERLYDPRRYESTTIAGELLRNTPFSAAVNRPALNAFGEPAQFASNRFVSFENADPVWQMVVRRNLRVSVPDKYIEMPNGQTGTRRIEPDEYYELLVRSGPQIKKYLRDHLSEFMLADHENAQRWLDEVAQGARQGELYKLRQRALNNPRR